MFGEIRIPCELVILPGGPSRQARLSLKVNGETVFEDYEESLSSEQKELTKQIAAAQGRLLTKWAQEK